MKLTPAPSPPGPGPDEGTEKPIHALLLDVGGILTGDTWQIVADTLSPDLRRTPIELLSELGRFQHALDVGGLTLAGMAESLDREFNWGISKHSFRDLVLGSGLRIVPRNVEFFKRLRTRKNLRTVAVSNVCAEIARAVEDRFSLYSLFDARVLSFEINATKPDARFLSEAEKASRCRRDEALFVDDSELNISAARRWGYRTAYMISGSSLRKALRGLAEAHT